MNIEQSFNDGRPSVHYEAIQLHYLLKISSSNYGRNDQCLVYKADPSSGYYIYCSINVPDHYLLWDEQANSWAHVRLPNLTLNTHYPFKTLNNYDIIVNRPPSQDQHLYFFDSAHHNVIHYKGSTFTRTRPYTKGYVDPQMDFVISTPLPHSVVQNKQLDNSHLNLRHHALLLATLLDKTQLLFAVRVSNDDGSVVLVDVDDSSPSFLRPGYMFWVVQELLVHLMTVKVKHFLVDDIKPQIASGSLLTDFNQYSQLVVHTFHQMDLSLSSDIPPFIAQVELIASMPDPPTEITLPVMESGIDGFALTVTNHTDIVVNTINVNTIHGSIPSGYSMTFYYMTGAWRGA